MKRSFVISGGQLTSALVSPETADALSIGDRISISRPLEVGYGALLLPGERGTVDHVDASTGLVEILMDTFHRGLDLWHNHMWLQPFGTEDIIDGIVLVHMHHDVSIRLMQYA